MKIPLPLRYATVSAVLLAFSGCATTRTETASASSATIISNSHWRLTRLGDETIDNPANGREIQFAMEYQDKRIAGYAGCNRFFGHYEMNGDAIKFDQIGSTKMFCEGRMDVEQKFLSTLGEAARWKINEGTLQLFDANGRAIAAFEGNSG